MNILDKRATNPAAALNGTELVYVAQLGADAVTTVQDIKDFATNGFVAKNAPITGATKTKITYNADGLITSGADATTADIADSPNRRYITDAQQTVLNNTSNTNSGDETTATIKTKLGTASSGGDGYLTSTDWNTFNTKQAADATLTALAAFNTNGILVQTAADTFAGRSFADSSDITWTNPAGTAGNISALLTNTAVIAGTYGSGTAIPVLQLDVKGRVVAVSTTPVVMGREIGGGGGNTLSATAVAINCTNCTISGANTTLMNCNGVDIAIPNVVGEGSLIAPFNFTLKMSVVASAEDSGTATLTADGTALSVLNAPRANYPASNTDKECESIHKVKIMSWRDFGGGERQWLVIGERTIKVTTTGVGNVHNIVVATVGTDKTNGAAGLSVTASAANGATSPLNIGVAITGGAYGIMIFKAEIESTYIPHT